MATFDHAVYDTMIEVLANTGALAAHRGIDSELAEAAPVIGGVPDRRRAPNDQGIL